MPKNKRHVCPIITKLTKRHPRVITIGCSLISKHCDPLQLALLPEPASKAMPGQAESSAVRFSAMKSPSLISNIFSELFT